MKKKLVMILMAVMVASATLGGCGQKGAETGTSVSAEEEDVQISYKELMKATDYKVQKYVKLNDYMNMTVELFLRIILLPMNRFRNTLSTCCPCIRNMRPLTRQP